MTTASSVWDSPWSCWPAMARAAPCVAIAATIRRVVVAVALYIATMTRVGD